MHINSQLLPILLVAVPLCFLTWLFKGQRSSAVIALGFGLPFVIFSIYYLYIDTLFEDEDVIHVQGIVDNLNEIHGRGSAYLVNYHYSMSGEQISARDIPVSFVRWSRLRLGEALPIKYLSEMPKESRIDYSETNQHYWRTNLLWLFFGVFSICIGLYKMSH